MKMPRPIACPQCSAMPPAEHHPECMYAPWQGTASDPIEPVGWRKIVEPAKDAYWQARRDGKDETKALLAALDVAVAAATGK